MISALAFIAFIAFMLIPLAMELYLMRRKP